MHKEKPYVICHMLGSVDGRIKQDIWGFKDHHKYFEETAEEIEAGNPITVSDCGPDCCC